MHEKKHLEDPFPAEQPVAPPIDTGVPAKDEPPKDTPAGLPEAEAPAQGAHVGTTQSPPVSPPPGQPSAPAKATTHQCMNVFAFPFRPFLSEGKNRICLYDEECPGLSTCLNRECLQPFMLGQPCKVNKTEGPLVGLKLDQFAGTEESCRGLDLACDPFFRVCQFEASIRPLAANATAACLLDSDCPFNQACDSFSGICHPLPGADQPCFSSRCQKPFICHQGMCRRPCFSDYDCFIGKPMYDTVSYVCVRDAGVCVVSKKEPRIPDEELARAFGIPYVKEDFEAGRRALQEMALEPPPQQQSPPQPSPASPSGEAPKDAAVKTSPSTTPIGNDAPRLGEPAPGSAADNTGKLDQGSVTSTPDDVSPDAQVDESAVTEEGLEGKKMYIIGGACAGGLVLLLLVLFLIWRRRRGGRTRVRKDEIPIVAPAFLPAAPAPPVDYKDRNFALTSPQAPGEAPPPLYKYPAY